MDELIFEPERPASLDARYRSSVRLTGGGVSTEGISLVSWLPLLRGIGQTWGIQERPEGYEHAFITLTPDSNGDWTVPNGDIVVGERYRDERLERHGLEMFEVNGLYVDREGYSAAGGRGEGIRFSTHEDWSAFLVPATEPQVREVLRMMVRNHARHLRGKLNWELVEAEVFNRISTGMDVQLVTDPIRGSARMRWMKTDTRVWSWPWFFRHSTVWRVEPGSAST